SYRPAGASHPYSLMFEGDSVLVFTFANINLPDSVSDPQGSQGFVAYTLQHAASLSPGTQIDNRAAIYFDYNPPIITNTVRNTIFTYPEVAIDSLHWDYLCFPYDLTAQLSVLGTSPYTYQWNTGAQGLNTGDAFVTPIDSSRFYSLTVTDALGFETSDSVYWEVRYTPVADLMVSATTPLTYEFSSLSLHATSYIWDFGDGSPTVTTQNATHTYAFDGSYTTTLIVSNECGSDTTTVLVLIGNIDSEFARSIKVVPNPFRDQTEISFDNPQGHAYGLRLYDQQGRIVREYAEQRGDHFRIERGELSAGLYLFEIHHESGSYTAKLMIQ
ncbi:MAG: PKD domain-containing protein, partial [Bacteroidota bacterium]